eukprot:4606046-Pyramimonas_sp.AAC.1
MCLVERYDQTKTLMLIYRESLGRSSALGVRRRRESLDHARARDSNVRHPSAGLSSRAPAYDPIPHPPFPPALHFRPSIVVSAAARRRLLPTKECPSFPPDFSAAAAAAAWLTVATPSYVKSSTVDVKGSIVDVKGSTPSLLPRFRAGWPPGGTP